MFIKKNKYYLLIESIKDIDLKKIKIRNKFAIIYETITNLDNLIDLQGFRRKCKLNQ